MTECRSSLYTTRAPNELVVVLKLDSVHSVDHDLNPWIRCIYLDSFVAISVCDCESAAFAPDALLACRLALVFIARALLNTARLQSFTAAVFVFA